MEPAVVRVAERKARQHWEKGPHRVDYGRVDLVVAPAALVLVVRVREPHRGRTEVRARGRILGAPGRRRFPSRTKAALAVPLAGRRSRARISSEDGQDRHPGAVSDRVRDRRTEREHRIVHVRRHDHDVAVELRPPAEETQPAKSTGRLRPGDLHGMIMTVTEDQLTLETLGSIGEARAGWMSLAAASGNPFASVEWCEAWLEHAAAAARPRLFAALRHGEPVAIVPLVILHGRYVRKSRFLGYGAANELGPIGASDSGPEALRLALDATRREWDVFHGETLPGSGWPERLGATLVGHEGSPVVTGPWSSWDDYLATRSHNFRSELRRKERRLVEGGLVARTISDQQGLEPALDALFQLHRRRWGEEASPFFAGLETFHRAFAKVALERGWLRLRVFELNGRIVAVTHGFRFGESEWSYQFGRDPGLDHSSLGLIASAQAIREAFAEGARDFKLGPGRQDYKLRFATGDPGLETVGIARGLRGRASLISAKRRAG